MYLDAVERASERTGSPPPIRGIEHSSVGQPGQMLAGRYRVERVLGAGGMGVVIAAHHVFLDVPVALKLMTAETLADEALVSRFLREARATAQLRGEHVVRVTDVGTLESGVPFMVMEHLQGQDLGALLASLGPPPISSAIEYAIQICEALDEAHRAGIVHRDVKPSNLFLTRRPNGTPCIKVLDFGIAKALTMAQASEFLHSTSNKAVFGTPFYMAPEQMRSARDVDSRADLWSLGATLYELLTGVPPFPAESLVDLAYRVANEAPPSITARRPGVPRGLEQIVFRCLERDPAYRFPDARSLAVALEEYRASRWWEDSGDDDPEEEKTVVDPTQIEPAPVVEIGEGFSSRSPEADSSLAPIDNSTSLLHPRATEAPMTGGTPGQRWRSFDVFAASQQYGSLVYLPIAVLGVVACATILGARAKESSVPMKASAEAPSSTFLVAPPVAIPSVVRLEPTVERSAAPPTISVTDLPLAPPPPPAAPVTTSAPLLATAAPWPVHSAPQAATGIVLTNEPRSATKLVAPTPSATRPAADCQVPYFIDELGRKIFRPECVN